MKNTTMISLLVGGIAVAGLTAPSFAAQQEPPAQQEKGGISQPFNGKVEAVDPTANTFTIGGLLFRVITDTKLMKEGKPITLTDIKVGDQVNGTSRKASGSEAEALTVTVNPAGENKEQSQPPKY